MKKIKLLEPWIPLMLLVAAAVVPLVLFGIQWRWWPLFGYPLPLPIPDPS